MNNGAKLGTAMPLTRNLYREEEVIAALRLAVARGRTTEAVFWVQEGLDSDMDVEILQTLLSIWLYTVGMSNLSWLFWFLSGLKPENPFTEADIVALTTMLVNSAKSGDSTVFAMLAIGMEAVTEDHVGFTILPATLRSQTLSKHETTFVRAIQQGKFVLAWELAKPLWGTGRAAELLEDMDAPQFQLEHLGPVNSEEFLWPFRALSLLIANSKGSLHRILEPSPVADPNILAEWVHRKTLPMRSRRIYAVPYECLYSYTGRGNKKMNQTTDRDLTHRLEESMVSSTFWNQFEDNFTSSGRLRENFYRTYFMNDIPDEWSAEDRAKSHGSGAIPTIPYDSALFLERCLRRFYRVPSKGIWGGLDRAIAILVAKNSNESVFHEYYSETNFTGEPISTWNMNAMKMELETMV